MRYVEVLVEGITPYALGGSRELSLTVPESINPSPFASIPVHEPPPLPGALMNVRMISSLNCSPGVKPNASMSNEAE